MKVAAVSVVIPCFDCAHTVERAVRSVLEQTLPPVEVLLVDDGSRDHTPQVLNRLAMSDARIRVMTLAVNQGPGAARNAGWEAATQPYVAFLDADDVWHPRKVEFQYGWMHAHPNVALTGHRVAQLHGDPVGVESVTGNPRIIEITGTRIAFSNAFQTSSVMLRRPLSFRFDPEQRYCEDFLLWLRTVLKGHEARLFDVTLAYRFKFVYGFNGLSGRLWSMEKGELWALSRAWSEGLLGWPVFAVASVWSLLKFCRRAMLLTCKRLAAYATSPRTT